MRGCSWGPIRPLAAPRSRNWPLIPLDQALPASRFQAVADLNRLFRRAERAGIGPVIDALLTEIDPLDQRRVRTEHARELVLQRPVGGLRIGLVLLRGDLNEIAAARGGGCRLGPSGRGNARRAPLG